MKIFLVVVALVTLLFGLVELAFPAELASVFAETLDLGSQVVARLFGASLLGWALLNGLAANLPPGRPLTAIMFANFAEDGRRF